MATDKKSFLIYCDLIHTVKKLNKEDAGELFLHILEYTNDLDPKTNNVIVDLVFEPIKQQLKRDLRAYNKSLEDRSYNGRLGNLKRWNLDLYNDIISEKITIEQAEKIAISRKASLPDSELSPPIANIAVKDNVNDNDTVKDTVKVKDIIKEDIDSRKLKFAHTLKEFSNIYSREMLKDFYDYWTETNENGKKFKREMQRTWNLKRRLETWFKNENKFNTKKQSNEKLNIITTEIRNYDPTI